MSEQVNEEREMEGMDKWKDGEAMLPDLSSFPNELSALLFGTPVDPELKQLHLLTQTLPFT